MSSKEEAEANQLVKDAQAIAAKASKSKGSKLGGLFSSSKSSDDASELYQRAANLFKMSKNWQAAGDAFAQAGSLLHQQGNQHGAAAAYMDASTCLKKISTSAAIQAIEKAIELHVAMGKFSLAAKHHCNIAELLEDSQAEKAIEHYAKAADYYEGEDEHNGANRCRLKMADHSALAAKQYERAVDIYEQIAMANAKKPLLKHSACDHFNKALLCRLQYDVIGLVSAAQRYVTQVAKLQDTPLYVLVVKKLASAVEESDVDAFDKAIEKHEEIVRLDEFTRALLMRAKEGLGADDLT